MYQIDLQKPCTVYFIGIGGISMSGFARLFHENGFTVRGSDMQKSSITEQLAENGISIVYGQQKENITDDIDFIVYTAAIHQDNPEFVAARTKNIPMMERAVMVGQVMKNYSNAIGVAGTHGKTTTTSMLSHVFLSAKKDPTISVGGILDAIQGNIRIGHSENFITEACEYTNSFLKFYPTAEIILNIEADHLDFFKDIEDIRHSFRRFAELLPAEGLLVINAEIPAYQELIEGLSCRVITYSLEGEADYTAENIQYDDRGYAIFDLVKSGRPTGNTIHLGVMGLHNVSNALSVIALAQYYQIPMEQILTGLSAFKGTKRRFEVKGSFQGVTVIDDYAHHPTEIAATLKAARQFPHKHLWCVFQPHTYSRTRALLTEFAQALSQVENIILTDIYAAREQNPGDISSLDLKRELEKLGKEVSYFATFNEIEDFLRKKCFDGDLLITMGAGNVVNIGDDLIK